MFWAFLLLTSLALLLVKLGALSTWFVVLKLGLLAALTVIFVLAAILLWRKAFHRQ